MVTHFVNHTVAPSWKSLALVDPAALECGLVRGLEERGGGRTYHHQQVAGYTLILLQLKYCKLPVHE